MQACHRFSASFRCSAHSLSIRPRNAPHLPPQQRLHQRRLLPAVLVAVAQLAAKALAPGEQRALHRDRGAVKGPAGHLRRQGARPCGSVHATHTVPGHHHVQGAGLHWEIPCICLNLRHPPKNKATARPPLAPKNPPQQSSALRNLVR